MDDTPKWEREGFKDDGSLACLGLTTDRDSKTFSCPVATQQELATNFHLTLKGNWQVFPVEARGIDFLGYVVRHDYVRLRKRTKINIQRKLQACIDAGMDLNAIHNAMGSYYGWLKYADCKHLIQTLNNKANGNIFQSKTRKGRAVRQ